MKIYYDFIIKDNTFSIIESQRRLSGSAHSALIKIQSILNQIHTFVYKGSEADVVGKLKGIASVIVKQYREKASQVHWLIRCLCCCFLTRKTVRVNAVYQRIRAVIVQPLERYKDLGKHVLSFLSLSDIANFSAVSKKTHALANPLRQKIERPFTDGLLEDVKGMTKKKRNKALCNAARNSDTQKLHCLLVFGADPNAYEDHAGNRALHWAAYNCTVQSVKRLIQYRAVLNEPGDRYGTPFIQAFCSTNTENKQSVMRIFLEKGIDPNTILSNKKRLINVAISTNKIEIVQMLLEFKADPNRIDDFGYHPMHYAATKKNIACTTLLLDAGATINQPTQRGYTPLFIAYPSKNVMQLLLERRANPNCRDPNGESLVDHMAYKGEKELLALMIAHGAQINVLGNGMTPLGWACGGFSRQKGYVHNREVVELLLEKKANSQLPMKDGRLALQIAQKHGLHDLADILLKTFK